jgi:hypothetical protein
MTCGGWHNTTSSTVLYDEPNYNGTVTLDAPGQCAGVRYTDKGEWDPYSCDCKTAESVTVTSPLSKGVTIEEKGPGSTLIIPVTGPFSVSYPSLNLYCPDGPWEDAGKTDKGQKWKCKTQSCSKYCDEEGAPATTCTDHIAYLNLTKKMDCRDAVAQVKKECQNKNGECSACDPTALCYLRK